jgi:adenylate cyclase
MVRDQIRDKLAYPFEDRGEQSVKNIARPVRVYALRREAVANLPATSVPVAAARRRRSALPAIAAAIVAVLVAAVGAWWLWPTTKSSPTSAVAAAPAAVSIPQSLVAPRLSHDEDRRSK